jgi:hypothetical protein
MFRPQENNAAYLVERQARFKKIEILILLYPNKKGLHLKKIKSLRILLFYQRNSKLLSMLLHPSRVSQNIQHCAGRRLHLCFVQHAFAGIQFFILCLQFTITEKGFVNLLRLLFGGLVV